MPATIAILAHEHDAFQERTFFLKEIAEIWQEQGIKVVVLNGPGAAVEADLAIVHVDLTIVPPEIRDFSQSFKRVLNGRVVDVSKRLISANLVSKEENYPGPVVVKTNRNYGGASEARLAKATAKPEEVERWPLHWSHQSQLASEHYPIFNSVDQVPEAVWDNHDLIVERFLPERSGEFYCLRTWVFLGDKETNSICYSHQPIIKSRNVVSREKVPHVPDDLREIREKLGFDFGKFDYVMFGDRAILYDANPTPTLGRFPREQFLPNLLCLAEGINTYLVSV